MREKLNSKVLFDEDSWTRFQSEVPKVRLACVCIGNRSGSFPYSPQMKLVTPSALVERLKINVSLARAACKQLAAEGKLNVVEDHHAQRIYTRVSA